MGPSEPVRPSGGKELGDLGVLAHRLDGPVTGVGRYLANLLEQWAGQLDAGDFPFRRIVLLADRSTRHPAPRRGFAVRAARSSLPQALWEQVRVPLLTRGLAVLFCPSYSVPLLARCPTVVVTHDMLQATRPQDYPRLARYIRGPLYKLSARHATAVVTHARVTVPEIVTRYGVNAGRVHAIPIASDSRFSPVPQQGDTDARRRHGLHDTPFVLFVGKMLPRRHIPELITGFGRAVATLELPHRLVLVGPNPQALAVTELGDGALRDRLCYLGHVADEDLSALYRQAALFAYLSEDEGFGLPLIEAMQSGVAVLTLDRPVFREVVGTAAHLIPDARPATVATALATLLSNHPYRASLAEAGARRAAEFDWSVTARRTLDVLTSVARGAPHDPRDRSDADNVAEAANRNSNR